MDPCLARASHLRFEPGLSFMTCPDELECPIAGREIFVLGPLAFQAVLLTARSARHINMPPCTRPPESARCFCGRRRTILPVLALAALNNLCRLLE